MNVFALDREPQAAAAAHCDKHVVKMVLETAQLLSTMVHVLRPDRIVYRDVDGYDGPRPTFETAGMFVPLYKPTHKNHPCSVWLRESRSNVQWLADLGKFLSQENQARYGHPSFKSWNIIRGVVQPAVLNDLPLPLAPQTPFALAMPKELMVLNLDPVLSYRLYYASAKRKIATWKTAPPVWWSEMCAMADDLKLPTTNHANDGVKE